MALATSLDVGLGATTSTCNFNVSRMNDAVVGPMTAILTRCLLPTDSAEESIRWNWNHSNSVGKTCSAAEGAKKTTQPQLCDGSSMHSR